MAEVPAPVAAVTGTAAVEVVPVVVVVPVVMPAAAFAALSSSCAAVSASCAAVTWGVSRMFVCAAAFNASSLA